MDFNTSRPAAPAPAAGGAARKGKGKSNWGGLSGLLTAVAAVAVVAILAWLVVGGAAGKKEAGYVNEDQLQAVFLNTGQVYFGNVKALNSEFVELTNIYYLQTSQTGSGQNAGSNVSLVKLGCELHQPDDKMIINRDQVTFWENLHDSGQVAKAVSTFEKQNPNGQKCADQSSAANTNSGSSAQPAGSSNTGGASSTGTGSNNQ